MVSDVESGNVGNGAGVSGDMTTGAPPCPTQFGQPQSGTEGAGPPEVAAVDSRRIIVLTYLTWVGAFVGVQIWVTVKCFSTDHQDCEVLVKMWVIGLLVVWSVRACGFCVNRYICCWHPTTQPKPPAGVRMKDCLIAMFFFVWFALAASEWNGSCAETSRDVFVACKVYIFLEVFNLGLATWYKRLHHDVAEK